jgi:hypothetical protein
LIQTYARRTLFNILFQNFTLTLQSSAYSLLYHVLSFVKIIPLLQAVSLQYLKGFPARVSFVMILAAGVIAVMEVAIVVHDLNLFQVGFEQLEILQEKRLKIFVLAQPEPGAVWG